MNIDEIALSRISDGTASEQGAVLETAETCDYH